MSQTDFSRWPTTPDEVVLRVARQSKTPREALRMIEQVENMERIESNEVKKFALWLLAKKLRAEWLPAGAVTL